MFIHDSIVELEEVIFGEKFQQTAANRRNTGSSLASSLTILTTIV